jgi:hypothetical protein
MRRLFLFHFSLINTLVCLAGNPDDSLRKLLEGSWKNTGEYENGKYAEIPLEQQFILTLYSDGTSQEEVIYLHANNWWGLGVKSKWRLNNQTIHLRKREYLGMEHQNRLPKFALKGPDRFEYEIIYSSKDSIVLRNPKSSIGSPDNRSVVFKHLPPRPRRKWNEQPDDVILVSREDSTKKQVILAGSSISLELKMDSFSEGSHTIEGQLIAANPDSVTIWISREHVFYLDKLGIEHSDDLEYKGPHGTRKAIAFTGIKNLKTTGPKHPWIKTIGGAAVFLSIVSALVISPLSASDFVNKRFDVPDFLIYSGASILGGLLVGVPLLAIGQGTEDVYRFDEYPSNKNETIWKIKSNTP